MPNLPELLEGVKARQVRALAKAISLAENAPSSAEHLLAGLGSVAPRSLVVGITGATGVGKSTLIKALIEQGLKDDLRIAVLAVDPSSPLSGGALLGDRIRMVVPETEPERLFIRSLSSRGNDGGVSRGIAVTIQLVRHAGYDVVLVETTGAGQCEFDVVRFVDLVCVLLAEGFGDELQAMKSGLMEIADLLVINKCRRPGTANLHRELESHLAHSSRFERFGLLQPPVLLTDALSGNGIAELWLRLKALAQDEACLAACARKRQHLAHYSAVASILELLKGRLLARLREDSVSVNIATLPPLELRRWLLEVCHEELSRKHYAEEN
ncbi:MAG TPA: methylmalonyl Co-A mutase-associated GTPase MeaB [Verrucomicrobiota bacterium]|nr:methylmalonyl Co-A mutase-associated GTPase MeaB [Verrucomicrobiales bacterium]HRI11753.1 methylmalonyl Co-A mutase-associated GTPase MeaB [Verrucomicrobiota bacterium]